MIRESVMEGQKGWFYRRMSGGGKEEPCLSFFSLSPQGTLKDGRLIMRSRMNDSRLGLPSLSVFLLEIERVTRWDSCKFICQKEWEHHAAKTWEKNPPTLLYPLFSLGYPYLSNKIVLVRIFERYRGKTSRLILHRVKFIGREISRPDAKVTLLGFGIFHAHKSLCTEINKLQKTPLHHLFPKPLIMLQVHPNK